MTSTRTRAQRRSARVAAAAPGADGVFTHRRILTILAGLMTAMFLAALDQTVVSTAIRTIADDLQGYDLQAWATTAFLITSTISTPAARPVGHQAAQAEAAALVLADGDPADAGDRATRAVGAAAPTSTAPPVGRPGGHA